MTDPWRDKTRVASARRGIAQARATLEIVRVGDVYTVAGETFTSWDAACRWILEQPEGEQP